jgi:hypothetical protein
MAFAYFGKLDGHLVNGGVDDSGDLWGNPHVRIRADVFVRNEQRVAYGTYVGPARLNDPRAARAVLAEVLDPGSVRFEGDDPGVDPLPKGAVS